MPQHAEVEEWQRNMLGEEDAADAGRDLGKSISYTADHEVLERRGLLDERRPRLLWLYVPLDEEGGRQLEY